MSALDLTVVVPTYNRLGLLRGAIDSLRRQTADPACYEIIILSDGCTDGTDEAFQTPLTSPATRLIRQEKRGFGLSAARNRGLCHARGNIILYFDDDMSADERLIEAHLAAHRAFPEKVAVCGQVRLAPEIPRTAFARLVLEDVCRVYREDPDQGRFLSFDTALSWQTSYRREDLEALGGFDETFRQYGWEDIEFSYRATREGFRYYYEPAAMSFHRDQRYTLAAHGERLRGASRMAPSLLARHPELKEQLAMYHDKTPIAWGHDRLPVVAKKLARRATATGPAIATLGALSPLVEGLVTSPSMLRRWYYAVLGGYVALGYREGLALAAREHHPAGVGLSS